MVYSNVFSGKLGIHEVLCSVCKHHHVMEGRGQQTIWLSWAKGWKPVGNDRTFSLGWCSEVDGNLNSRRDRGGGKGRGGRERTLRKGEERDEGNDLELGTLQIYLSFCTGLQISIYVQFTLLLFTYGILLTLLPRAAFIEHVPALPALWVFMVL